MSADHIDVVSEIIEDAHAGSGPLFFAGSAQGRGTARDHRQQLWSSFTKVLIRRGICEDPNSDKASKVYRAWVTELSRVPPWMWWDHLERLCAAKFSPSKARSVREERPSQPPEPLRSSPRIAPRPPRAGSRPGRSLVPQSLPPPPLPPPPPLRSPPTAASFTSPLAASAAAALALAIEAPLPSSVSLRVPPSTSTAGRTSKTRQYSPPAGASSCLSLADSVSLHPRSAVRDQRDFVVRGLSELRTLLPRGAGSATLVKMSDLNNGSVLDPCRPGSLRTGHRAAPARQPGVSSGFVRVAPSAVAGAGAFPNNKAVGGGDKWAIARDEAVRREALRFWSIKNL